MALPRTLLSAAVTLGHGAQVHGWFEMLGMPQRDITPESAADRLRACSEQHFWQRT